MRVSYRMASIIGGLLMLAGCATVGPADIHPYTDAFQDARKAGDLILDQASEMWLVTAAAEGKQAAACAKDKLGVHPCFDLVAAASGVSANDPPDIRMRRLALEVVSNYSSALLDIAEGRWTSANQLHLADLAASAQGFMQLAAIPAGAVSGFLTPAALQGLDALATASGKIRDARIVRQAIIDGAPTVRAILIVLTKDTPDLYKIYRAGKLLQVNDGKIEKAAAVADINAYYDKLEKYVGVLQATDAALDTLIDLASNPGPSAAGLRAVVAQAADIRSKADAFWQAAHAPAS